MIQEDTGTQDLLVRLEDKVAVITLNRPEARNAMSGEMNAALQKALYEAELDPQVGCIVLTGAGKGFCAGGDVKGMASSGDGTVGDNTIDGAIHRQRDNQRATAGKLFKMPKPTIASLPGAAAGAGLSLALACDLRIMSSNAFMTTAFAKVGFSGDYGGTYFMTQLIGSAKARELYNAGVRRINVSLDHLDSEKFREITRWGDLEKVKRGLKKARDVGLKIKINTVAISNFNQHHLPEILAWCGDENFDMTIIEVMPMGDIGGDKRYGQYLPLSQVRKELEKKFTLKDLPERTSGPARYVSVKETNNKLGFITPLTHNFCESCNRVRLTCTGILYMCLGQEDNADLKTVLREKGLYALEDAIKLAIERKPKGHDFEISRKSPNVSVSRHMSLTGG